MDSLSTITSNKNTQPDSLKQLLHEIETLQNTLGKLEQKLSAFEDIIRKQLHAEIRQMASLSTLHKQYQAEKKNKRLEQKRKGKNYKASNSIAKKDVAEKTVFPLEPEGDSLKKLYKEAVIRIHPDKIGDQAATEKIQNATVLTARLNEIYKSGDLDELKYFYQSVILRQETQTPIVQGFSSVNSQQQKEALIKKKSMILDAIEKLQNSYTNQVLNSYENPLIFVDELKVHFQEKIRKLEKRTRKIRKR
ncbi:MAG: hypothetical protein ACFCUU_01070 [Cyclobacteriaceae bacterium]